MTPETRDRAKRRSAMDAKLLRLLEQPLEQGHRSEEHTSELQSLTNLVCRLLLTTGFLGGLTTFSTFSAEVVTLLVRGEYLWGSLTIASHVVGSLALTIAGLLVVRAVYAWGGA